LPNCPHSIFAFFAASRNRLFFRTEEYFHAEMLLASLVGKLEMLCAVGTANFKAALHKFFLRELRVSVVKYRSGCRFPA